MRRPTKRVYELLLLIALLAVPLLATAAPALADGPQKGKAAHKHWRSGQAVNGQLIEIRREVFSETSEHVVYKVVTDNRRVNGIMDLWVTDAWITEDGEVAFSGWWHLVTRRGSWHDDVFVGVESAGYLVGEPFTITVLPDVAVGAGANRGLRLRYSAFKGAEAEAPFVLEGRIKRAPCRAPAR